MTDIVEQLVKIADAGRRSDGSDIPLTQAIRCAADEITRLRAELDKSRKEALEEAAQDDDPWKREQGVDDILAKYREFIRDRPALTSLLYDIDMLPEQTVSYAGAVRLAGLCEVWRKGEAGEIPKAKSA